MEKNKKRYRSRLERQSKVILKTACRTQKSMNEYYQKMTDSLCDEEEVKQRIRSYKKASANLTKANRIAFALQDEINARNNDINNSKKKSFIPNAPSNSKIDLTEKRSHHFAKGLNIYKLLLICFIGSFAGVVIEMLWCLIVEGFVESRAGLVYGPFNLLYGLGAVALTMMLYKYRNRSKIFSFVGGVIVGSAVEYVSSWFQEMVYGTRPWDYSNMVFNLNGRICLFYSVIWGVLSIVWIKDLYPRIAWLILKIPNKVGKIGTWIMTVFMIVNILVTMAAMYRWSERMKGTEPSNALWSYVDSRFDDSRMSRIFPNIEFDSP